MKDISFCVISDSQQYAEDVPSHCAEGSECALAPYSGTQAAPTVLAGNSRLSGKSEWEDDLR
jgi:hypothetical protein